MWRIFLKIYFFFVFFALLFSGASFAASGSMPMKGFLMWQFPAVPTGPQFPIYVYQGNTRVAYIPTPESQSFVGAYEPGKAGKSDGTYALYYKGTDNNWYSCSLVLSNGQVDPATTCPGVVINNPACVLVQNSKIIPQLQSVCNKGAGPGLVYSTVWTVAFGAAPWAKNPLPSGLVPAAPDYTSRSITFVNNTVYPKIKMSGSYAYNCHCKVPSANQYVEKDCPKPANPAQPNWICDIASINKQVISKTKPYVFYANQQNEVNGKPIVNKHGKPINNNGINSAAFYMTEYCAGKCNNPKSWVSTGGYGVGETAYATKIEFTILPLNSNGVPTGASNADISAVDGFNTAVQLASSSNKYCTYTLPPENSNLLGAGSYGPGAPLAKLVSTGPNALQSLCENSSQLCARCPGALWTLSVMDQSKSRFLGCRSPCSYASASVVGSPARADMNQFCCAGPYATPASCIVSSGKPGANTSTYVTNILHSPKQFQNVYPFGYGDAGSDYACPPETSFVVTFT